MCSVGHFRVSEIVMAIKMPTVLWEKNFCIRQYLGCVFCSLSTATFESSESESALVMLTLYK